MSFLTVCLNPTIQKTLSFPSITTDAVNRTGDHRLDASGKGINVTRVLSQLGKKALHLTQLGGDMRQLFLSLCGQDGLSVEWVESGSQIRFSYTLLTKNNNAVTELVEESEPVASETEPLLLEKFNSILSNQPINCLIISGTKAAGFSDTLISVIAQKAKKKGLKVILDIKGNDLKESLKHEPDIIKPNLLEFASTFAPELIIGNELSSDDTLIKKLIKPVVMDISQKYRCRVILTNGSRKLLAAEEDNFFEIEIPSARAVNTTGCGDAFTAGLAAALAEGAGFKAAIDKGIICGALNAALIKPGTIR